MANYDTKLGEWFKQVEKRAEELLARKRAVDTPQDAEEATGTPRQVVSAEIEAPAAPRSKEIPPPSGGIPSSGGISESRPQEQTARADSSVLTAVDIREVAVADEPEPAAPARRDRGPALFDDPEIPPVEDFFSFLSRSGAREVEPKEEQPPAPDVPENQGMLTLAEGTGTPRPITTTQEEAAEPAALAAEPKPAVELTQPPAKPEQAAQVFTAEQRWERVPQHLHILFDGEVQEIAQHSYKTFKESRTSLIERLLDPSVTLEDAARLLNVCPTTVRRYTNRGVLKHYRTAGNQRRFRLSDVLAFMESKQ
jgi:excisionase family DNA binding protein